MNAFTEAAAEEAAVPDTTELSLQGVVSNFLAGLDGTSGDVTSTGGVLSDEGVIIARRTPNGHVLLSTEVNNVELNDALIGALALSGTRYRRMDGFNRLLNTTQRLNDIDNGNHDDFAAVASLFGFEYTLAELAAVELARGFRSRVETFFNERANEERRRIAAEQQKIAKEKAAREAIEWDNGVGPAHSYGSNVRGAGGGQRLRLTKASRDSNVTNGRKRFETSEGRTITYGSAKRAWDFATKYWHGGKEIPYRGARLNARGGGGYHTVVESNSLNYGCQSVTRKEAERIAAVMGWERAPDAAAAAAAGIA